MTHQLLLANCIITKPCVDLIAKKDKVLEQVYKSKVLLTSALVHLGDDGRADALQLLELVLQLLCLCQLVGIQPADSLIHLLLNLLAVSRIQLAGNLIQTRQCRCKFQVSVILQHAEQHIQVKKLLNHTHQTHVP